MNWIRIDYSDATAKRFRRFFADERIKLFRQGELDRLIVGVLREADTPIRTQHITSAILAAGLHIIEMNLDTTSATGTLMLQVLGAVAEHERTMMLKRQREGIVKAKAERKCKGRAKTAMAQAGEVRCYPLGPVRPRSQSD